MFRYTAFSVGVGYTHATLKQFDYPVTPELCKPVAGTTFYILSRTYTGSGSGGSGSGDGAVVTAVPPDAWIPAPASSRVRDRPGLDVVEDVEHE